MSRLTAATVLVLAATIAAAHAQTFNLGEAAYGGTGCPQGTARTVLGPGGSTLSILFDAYEAVAGGGGRPFDRKSCNLAIPLQVPAGYSVSVLTVDYRGYNHLPSGATSDFRVEYFLAGSTGPVFTRTFTGPRSEAFLISDAISTNVWSECGADVVLRANSSILVMTGGPLATATVDTEDVSAALVYHFQWRRC